MTVPEVAEGILTHGHPDHQGGARSLQTVSGARIVAPLDELAREGHFEETWATRR